ncbi:MAG: ArsR/SmtB family transcription factor [Paracoccaceae bacterium]
MKERQALAAFSALSQETRLRILRLVVVAGEEGMAAGTIAERVGVSASNVSFHIKEMELANLVTARRVGRSIIYVADHETLSALIHFLLEDCCSGRIEHSALSDAGSADCC